MVRSSNSHDEKPARSYQHLAMAALMMVLAVGGVAMSAGRAEAQSRLPPCPSDERVRWHNCFGAMTFASGNKYVGEWKDGQRNGQGTFTSANGNKYVGKHKDNLPNGAGKELVAKGNLIRQGYWVDGNYFGPTPPGGAKR